MTTTSPTALPASTRANSSASTAGWICLGLGYLTFWIFGVGFLFFSVTIILSIVAMCTNRVGQGVALLISSIASIVICGILFVIIVFGSIAGAVLKASEDIKHQQQIHQPVRLTPERPN
jgi:hypothetical protein